MNKYIYGFHSVNALLDQKCGALQTVFIDVNRKDKRIVELTNKLKHKNVVIQAVNSDKLESLVANVNHQGVIALVDTNHNYYVADQVKTLL